mgnify:CR=1 FL=1
MSDKTTAALAAEQADTEATTTQEAELLPAATLDELEQVDLGTVAEGERAPFRITDDRCADLKKLLSYTGDIATLTETGEIVEGVTVYETPGIFTVDV